MDEIKHHAPPCVHIPPVERALEAQVEHLIENAHHHLPSRLHAKERRLELKKCLFRLRLEKWKDTGREVQLALALQVLADILDELDFFLKELIPKKDHHDNENHHWDNCTGKIDEAEREPEIEVKISP
ncbi:MAG: hypothetical protein PWQ91_781 [Eubacteriales bacterium]|nr:hypothetical protein [Eubacteriales bacterium]MDN5363720.1 hypothetical protein [Eubacteriales bacterium]